MKRLNANNLDQLVYNKTFNDLTINQLDNINEEALQNLKYEEALQNLKYEEALQNVKDEEELQNVKCFFSNIPVEKISLNLMYRLNANNLDQLVDNPTFNDLTMEQVDNINEEALKNSKYFFSKIPV